MREDIGNEGTTHPSLEVCTTRVEGFLEYFLNGLLCEPLLVVHGSPDHQVAQCARNFPREDAYDMTIACVNVNRRINLIISIQDLESPTQAVECCEERFEINAEASSNKRFGEVRRSAVGVVSSVSHEDLIPDQPATLSGGVIFSRAAKRPLGSTDWRKETVC